MLKLFAILASIALVGCSFTIPKPIAYGSTAGPELNLEFQNGQTATLLVTHPNPAIGHMLGRWVALGVYQNAPVYRQLSGVFLLTGKPRLSGQGYQAGVKLEDLANAPKPHAGDVALIVHADGTVGPELMLNYGSPFQFTSHNVLAVKIGTITQGRKQLAKVQRGDNLLQVTYIPAKKPAPHEAGFNSDYFAPIGH